MRNNNSSITAKEAILFTPCTLKSVSGKRTLKFFEIAELAEGSIVKLDRYVGELVDLEINGCVIGKGELVTVNDTLSVRVVTLHSHIYNNE